MSKNTESQSSQRNLELIKWLVVIILLILTIVGNNYYHNYSLLLRTLFVIFMIAIASSISITTTRGKYAIEFIREARTEVRKIIWPTYQETLHTTLIVAVVTAIMSLILWGLDSLLIRIVSFITYLRF